MTTNNATTYEPFDLTTCWKRTHPKWIHNASSKEQELFYELTAEQKQDIVDIHRMAKTLHRIAENQCNGWPKMVTEYKGRCTKCSKDYQHRSADPANPSICENCGNTEYKIVKFEYGVENEAWRKADEAKEQRYEKRLQDIAKRNGWTIETQNDPRGAVVKLEINGRDMTNLIFA